MLLGILNGLFHFLERGPILGNRETHFLIERGANQPPDITFHPFFPSFGIGYFLFKLRIGKLTLIFGTVTALKGAGLIADLTVFFIKLSLVLGILTIFLYTIIFKNEPTGQEDQEELEEMAVEPVPFQQVALWLGVLIILCAATMKHLHT